MQSVMEQVLEVFDDEWPDADLYELLLWQAVTRAIDHSSKMRMPSRIWLGTFTRSESVILDGESIPQNERVVVDRSPLVVKNSWIYEGRPFDLSAHPTILAVARAVEKTRALCCRIIDGG